MLALWNMVCENKKILLPKPSKFLFPSGSGNEHWSTIYIYDPYSDHHRIYSALALCWGTSFNIPYTWLPFGWGQLITNNTDLLTG